MQRGNGTQKTNCATSKEENEISGKRLRQVEVQTEEIKWNECGRKKTWQEGRLMQKKEGTVREF